jgi:aminoglycoside phosphotransferase (APT) family kinase protein
MEEAELTTRLAGYIAGQMPQARDVAVTEVARITGGASRQTYRFTLSWTEADGQARRRGLILRRDPADSLIDTERRVEFEAYRAFHGTGVPVPEMLWLEEGSEALGSPFFVAEEIAGFQAGPGALWSSPYLETHAALGARKWEILGQIARADPAAIGLATALPSVNAEDCWRRELDHWEGVLDADESEPLPIIRAAIRHLRANPPPPAQKDALKWWELFACVKGQAIWVSSARAWLDGANRDPILVYPAWALINAQDRAALHVMGRL